MVKKPAKKSSKTASSGNMMPKGKMMMLDMPMEKMEKSKGMKKTKKK